MLLAVLADGQWHPLDELYMHGLDAVDPRSRTHMRSWRRRILLPRWEKLGLIEVRDGKALLLRPDGDHRPAGNRAELTESIRAFLADGEWHDAADVINRFARLVPPNQARSAWMSSTGARLRRRGVDPTSVPVAEQVRVGSRHRVGRVLTRWAAYGYIETDPPGWTRSLREKRVRWVCDEPRKLSPGSPASSRPG